MREDPTYRDRMKAADSFGSDWSATYGFARLHLGAMGAPIFAVGFFLSGKVLAAVAAAALSLGLWIEVAREYGWGGRISRIIAACCWSVALPLFLWAEIAWLRAYLNHQPWSYP